MVEIAKAVSYDAKVLILDEPTSSLTEREIGRLFKIIRLLRDRGMGIVYISHKIEEIFEISDDVTVFRDGKWVGTEKTADLDANKIVSMMVGRELTQRFPPKTNVPGDVIMEVKNLTGRYDPRIKDVSFDLREGEILGIAGLVGAGRTEVLETLFGIATRESGTVTYRGKEIHNENAEGAIDNGFALLTEERRATGIFRSSTCSRTRRSRVSINTNRKSSFPTKAERGDELGHRLDGGQNAEPEDLDQSRCRAGTSKRSSSAAGC